MRYIDFHCDTLTELDKDESLKDNSKSVNLTELKRAKVLVQCCSMFVPTGIIGADKDGRAYAKDERRSRINAECERIYDVYIKEMSENSDDLRKVLCFRDVEECIRDGKTGILLTIEDGGVLFGSIDRLKDMYEKGVRLITLTWNHINEIGYPNSSDECIMSKGLTDKGRELVNEMFDMNIIVDVSHLSDGGFYDVAKMAKVAGNTIVASHSNSRAVTGHCRNMTDDMIRTLAECGGVMGLNLAPHFLDESQDKDGSSRIADMVKHILHIRNVGGTDVLAIGSDFDGIDGRLEISKPADFEMLYSALKKAGLNSSELEKMWQANGLRILRTL